MSEWIKHDGKSCPVMGSEMVDVKFRDGHEDVGYSADWYSGWAGTRDHWLHKNDRSDIVEYRLVIE